MPANLLKPLQCTPVASATVIATGTSGPISMKMGESYLFILDVTAASGTSETLDVAIQVTPSDQNVATASILWYSVLRFAQVTTSTVKRYLRIQPTLGRGEAGSEGASADTGGALSANVPLSRKINFKWTVAGTSPSYTFAIYAIIIPKQAGTY